MAEDHDLATPDGLSLARFQQLTLEGRWTRDLCHALARGHGAWTEHLAELDRWTQFFARRPLNPRIREQTLAVWTIVRRLRRCAEFAALSDPSVDAGAKLRRLLDESAESFVPSGGLKGGRDFPCGRAAAWDAVLEMTHSAEQGGFAPRLFERRRSLAVERIRVPLLLPGTGSEGQVATLFVELVDQGSGQLFADPATMLVGRTFLDTARTACGLVWRGQGRSECDLRWRLEHSRGPGWLGLDGPSAGGAFALVILALLTGHRPDEVEPGFGQTACRLALEGVAVTAGVDGEGTLAPVGGSFEKLLAAARDRTLGRIHTVVVAAPQQGFGAELVPDRKNEALLVDPASRFAVLRAENLGEAVRWLCRRRRRRFFLAAAVTVLFLLIAAAMAVRLRDVHRQRVAVAPPPAAFTAKLWDLDWIAYEPTLYDPERGVEPTAADVARDLRQLHEFGWNGLITFQADGILAEIPRLAREQGFRGVIMGIQDLAEANLQRVIQRAEYVDGYCAGHNPYRDWSREEVVAAMVRLHRETRKPVTTTYYRDQYDDELIATVNWIFPDIGVRWRIGTKSESGRDLTAEEVIDRELDSLREAVEWAALRSRQSGKPALLKIVSFPSGGKEPFDENAQAAFYHEMLTYYRTDPSYPLKEVSLSSFLAYDQVWKSAADGNPAEAHTGLFDARRWPKPAACQFQEVPNGYRATSVSPRFSRRAREACQRTDRDVK